MTRIIFEVEEKQTDIPVRPFRPLEESANLSLVPRAGSRRSGCWPQSRSGGHYRRNRSGYTAKWYPAIAHPRQ